MKKISTLFVVEYATRGTGVITPVVRPENEWVYTESSQVTATRKFDGTAAMVKDGVLYKRYDAKNGKVAPAGAIPCTPFPDPVTTHHPHWLRVDFADKANKYFKEAWRAINTLPDGTYELCGERIGINAEHINGHRFIKHGSELCDLTDFSFESIKAYLSTADVEGIVFHHTDGRMCKIRKTDFGFER